MPDEATETHLTEPEILVEHREELIYLLTEAAEIEHGLMCCYLFAAYSLKRDEPELGPEERAAIAEWRRAILEVAREEMVHLALVSNLLVAVGSAPHFARPNFPVSPGYHPAGVVVSLAPFERATLDHFIYLERPEGVALPDGAGFAPARAYLRGKAPGRLVATAHDYATVGHLYRGIRNGLGSLARALGEPSLFVGDPRQQVGSDLLPMQGLTKVRSLAEAELAIDTIVLQGEGSSAPEGHASHYARFRAIAREYEALLEGNPSFVPGRPVARNPVMRRPPEPEGKVWISAEPAATLLDLTNASYALMLRTLAALFSPVAVESDARFALSEMTRQTMRVLGPLSERLTQLPASDELPGTTAGMTFTMSRSLSGPPDVRGLRGIAEGAFAVAKGMRAHPAGEVSLEPLATSLDSLAATLVSLSERSATVVAAAPRVSAPTPAVATSPASPAPAVEIARGKLLTVLFEGKRCIHSRHCVLDAPTVFLANTPGEWIFPDAVSVETLVGVARACPSGAIRYQRHDGGAEESAPPVNVARVRENGPVAINADIELAGHGAMLRATLCRCGKSNNKPFCDSSHVAAGFTASGEPPTGATDPLAARNGSLLVTPSKDGPLLVRGNLEVCAGDGAGDRAHHAGRVVPVRRLEQQALLRRDTRQERLPGRRRVARVDPRPWSRRRGSSTLQAAWYPDER